MKIQSARSSTTSPDKGIVSSTKDLHSFLEELEARNPAALLRIRTPMDTRYDITALQRKLDQVRRYPVIFVEKPITYEGKQSQFPLVTNLTASRELCAAILGMDPRQVAQQYYERMTRRLQPVVVDRSEAPCKEVIQTDKINLWELPVTIHTEMDPGPYIGTSFVTTIDPETGIDNMALQRIWVKSPARTGFWPAMGGHNWMNLQKWWARGKDMPVAIWIGHHPAGLAGAQARLGYPESHYPAMGGVMGEPVRLVATELFGDQIMVPADAEIVIEGYVPVGVIEAEGPFGEYPGYIGPQRPSPVIEVKCVTRRKQAVYHDVGVGLADHLMMMGNFPLEARIYDLTKRAIPEVLNVYVPLSGRRNHVYVQIQKTRPGIGRDVILSALTADTRLKHIFVVDEDIDIFNEEQVLWAVAYRSQWDKDIVVIRDMATFPLDPSISAPGYTGAKGGIDCTMPPPLGPGLPRPFQQTNHPPAEVEKRIRLEDFVTPGQLSKFPGQI
ncbi:MAG: UbiD family decarboxylase [Acidobacteria bacterium]|nr:UbiD family decarboxylase [Acidobacteriota bacterium]